MYPRVHTEKNMSKHRLIIEFKHATNSHDGAIFQLNAFRFDVHVEELLDGERVRSWADEIATRAHTAIVQNEPAINSGSLLIHNESSMKHDNSMRPRSGEL